MKRIGFFLFNAENLGKSLARMGSTAIVLPGDIISADQLPTSAKRKIGRGIQQETGSDIFISSIGGLLEVDFRKKNAYVLTPDARYLPKAGDLVIAQVRQATADFFHLHINAHSPQAFLPSLAFEGASRKTRPQLKNGDVVYAKVVFAQKGMEVELTCVNPSTGKSEPDGLGKLSGGMIFDVSPGLADRLLRKQGVTALDELGSKLQGGFEIAVGRNGKVWVDCPESGVKGIVAVGKCLQEMDDYELTQKEQKKLVTKIITDLERG